MKQFNKLQITHEYKEFNKREFPDVIKLNTVITVTNSDF